MSIRYKYYALDEGRNVVEFVPGGSEHDVYDTILLIAETEIAIGVNVTTAFDGQARLTDDGTAWSSEGSGGKPSVFWTAVTTDYGLEMAGCYPTFVEAQVGHERVVTEQRAKLADGAKAT